MAEIKKTGAKRIIDVTHADQTAPSDNSKSVIVGNRPLLKDPMVVPEAGAESASGDATKSQPPKTTSKNADQIKPATAPQPNIKPSTTTPVIAETVPPPTESSAKPAPSEPTAGAAETAKPDTDEHEAGQDAAKNQDDTDEAGSTKTPQTDNEHAQQQQAEAQAQAKHVALIDQLADSKKYYLPINTIEKRRSRRFVALGIVLSLLLVVAWADIALDAGLIQLHGVKPVTHFFSN